MQTKWLRLLLFAFIFSVSLLGCKTNPPPLPSASFYNNIDKFQAELADRVSSLFNPGNQADFKVVVSQASYPIGTVLRPNSTIPIDYTSCLLASKPPKIDANNLFPTYSLSTGLAIDFGLDSDVIKKLLNFGITVKDTDAVQVQVRNSQVELASDRDLEVLTAKAACKSVISKQPVWIIRGYILGQRSFETKNETANDVKGKIDKIASFDISLRSGNSSVNITDENPKEFLQIISALSNKNTATAFTSLTTPVADGKIYVQRDKLDRSLAAQKTANALSLYGFTVSRAIEPVNSSSMPRTAQVRYFNDADKPKAEKALELLKQNFNSAALVRVGLPAPSGQLEVWLPKASQ